MKQATRTEALIAVQALEMQRKMNAELPMVLVTLPTSSRELQQRIVQGLEALDLEVEFRPVEKLSQIGDLYREGRGLVGHCAAGVLIRAVAPLLKDKVQDPKLIAIADDGSSVIPLLGGHKGANAWSRLIADIVNGHPAITTASDLVLGLDFEAPPMGLKLVSSLAQHKTFVAGLLKGKGLEIMTDLPSDLRSYFASFINKLSVLSSRLPVTDSQAPLRLAVVDRLEGEDADHPADLLYCTRLSFLGLGASRGCPSGELCTLVDQALRLLGVSKQAIAGLGSHEIKQDEKAILRLAQGLELKPQFFDAQHLNLYQGRLSQRSDIVHRETGVWGVAEAAALAAAEAFAGHMPGLKAELTMSKIKSSMATCAIATLMPALEQDQASFIMA